MGEWVEALRSTCTTIIIIILKQDLTSTLKTKECTHLRITTKLRAILFLSLTPLNRHSLGFTKTKGEWDIQLSQAMIWEGWLERKRMKWRRLCPKA